MVPCGVSYKYLSSFNVSFRGTGRGFGKAPLQKHKRCAQFVKNVGNQTKFIKLWDYLHLAQKRIFSTF